VGWNPSVGAYRAAAGLARVAPRALHRPSIRALARLAERLTPERRLVVERNLLRVYGDAIDEAMLRRAVSETFESYGRYWLDSFRLPSIGMAELDGRFTHEGYEHIKAARAAGRGPLMVIPHLGGWEWAAFWLTRVERVGVTAVVEPLQPPELFEFFVDLRRSLGMQIVSLGPHAASGVSAAVRRRDVVCLLADRDIAGTGTEVTFFGEPTTLPSGPALLALRTGAPLIPCAVYFRDGGLHAVVRPPLVTERHGRLRDDVSRITQDVAGALESLIEVAPEQWHLMEPNWPSDREALAALG
jgi:phosphatidylinositol dimannoside acyltransferase